MLATSMVVSSVAALLLLLTMLASSPSGAANSEAQPSCLAACGGVDIPYPFGIGKRCSRPGFEITCSGSTPFLAGTGYKVLSLSLEPSGARVELPIAWTCYSASGKRRSSEAPVFFNPHGVYRISVARNQLVVVGCDVTAYLQSRNDSSGRGYEYAHYTGCIAYCKDAGSVQDGRCAGVGCCKVDIPPELTDNSIAMDDDDAESWSLRPYLYSFSPCNYGFLVDRNNYTFRRSDLKMDKSQTMPVWLDWAIRPIGSLKFNCSDGMKDSSSYACKAQHSSCANASNGPGYTCDCSQGYKGNAYIVDGCIDIDECLYPDKYTCHGVCHNTAGSYECKCKPGSHGNAFTEMCQPILPLGARIAIGVTFGISCIIILAIFMVMVHQKTKLRALYERNGGLLLENSIKIYTEKELKQITDNYSDFLGAGSFGKVYSGIIYNTQKSAEEKDVQKVAVKRPINVNKGINEDFANEVAIQSRVRHKNIVMLLGCCLEVEVPMLVYEYALNGSLHDALHGESPKRKSLSLGTRLDIAVDSTEGLAYMHSYANKKILHGDVKSGNILLDENFMPKISDFGLSRLLSTYESHTNNVIGDLGYIDPVYMRTGRLHEKSDVYSFGVVLLELITRKKPICGDNILMINYMKSYTSEDKIRDMYDVEIASPENLEFLWMVGNVAVSCLKEDMDERPTMENVAERLKSVRKEWNQRRSG